jgi:hypothetical protein
MKRVIVSLLIAGATLQKLPMARAATEVFSYVINPIGGYVETKSSSNGPVSLAKSGSDDRGSAASRASADFGVLRVFAEGHAANTGSAFQTIGGGAQAYFRDDLTIKAPGLDATSGTLTVKFKLDGAVSCSGGGDSTRASYADCHYEFRKNGSLLSEDYYLIYFDGTTEGNNFLGQERTVAVPFIFGQPMELKLFIESAARAYNFRGADAIADFEHTITWGGFVSVKDGNSGEVTSYTATSNSGANFVEAITPPTPKLAARSVGASQLEITWSTEFSDYQLYSIGSLAAPSWTLADIARSTNGTQITVTVPTSESQRFFILKKP